MSELDLNLLYVLVALDDRRSVSGAALQLQRSQPAVSSALSKLRAFFDDPLFVRTGNVMQPTPRAITIVESARDGYVWMQEYERGKPKKAVSKLGPQGQRRGTRTAFRADSQMFETTDYSFALVSERLRESAYLTKGVWITLIDERTDRAVRLRDALQLDARRR